MFISISKCLKKKGPLFLSSALRLLRLFFGNKTLFFYCRTLPLSFNVIGQTFAVLIYRLQCKKIFAYVLIDPPLSCFKDSVIFVGNYGTSLVVHVVFVAHIQRSVMVHTTTYERRRFLRHPVANIVSKYLISIFLSDYSEVI